jgi:predicted MFS family arabinose efflux permease
MFTSTELDLMANRRRGNLADHPARFVPVGAGAAPVRDRRPDASFIADSPKASTAAYVPPPEAGHRRLAPGVRRASWHVLGNPDFRLYFTGSTVSNLGTWLQNTAQALLAWHLTRSALTVGLVVCFQFTPVLLAGPTAGTVVGRVRDLRKMLIVTQIASAGIAGTLAILEFTGGLTVIELAAGALALGTAYCFALPAFSVLVPSLVPQDETNSAMAMNSVSYNIGRAVAPAIAVLIITFTGFGPAFAANAISFLVLAWVLRRARPRYELPRPDSQPRLMDGFRAARKQRIWLLLLMVTAVTVAADPVLVLGPALAHRFHVSDAWAGYFLSSLGIGTILGSLMSVRRPWLLRHAAYPLALLGAAIVIFSFGLDRWVCLAMALIAGIACLLTGAVTQTLLIDFAGKNRAAVMAVWAVAWAGSKPLASLADGFLATRYSVQTAGLVLALPALLPALAVITLGRPGVQQMIPRSWKQHLFSEVP